MPTYQYACTECEHRFEQVQAFSDASLTDCPICGGKLRKVYGSVGVVFKGSGFYRTDSRNGASEAQTGGDKADASTPADAGKSTPKESTPSKADSGSAAASTSDSGSSGKSGKSSDSSKKDASPAKPTPAAKSSS